MLVKASYCPTKEEFIKLARQDYNLIPVWREIVADLETPVSVYSKVFSEGSSCLLESVEGSARLSRYSFIAGDPFLTVKAHRNEIEINNGKKITRKQGSLDAVLRDMLKSFRAVESPDLPRFFGGAVGYIGYDSVRQFEHLPDQPFDDLDLPDACLIFPESVIAFDHLTSKLKVIVNARITSDPEKAYIQAVNKIEQLTAAIRNNQPKNILNSDLPRQHNQELEVESGISRPEFCRKVEKIKEHIRSGDILQAVLSQRFAVQTEASPFEVYRALRSINPSPYMYYLNFNDLKVAGASPEMLVRLDNGIVENRPIAGTRPRGVSPESDKALEEELLSDPKERAEHVMLVDLGRNDLGRVAKYGSVEVPVFMNCDRYSHVMHLVSEVKGIIADGKDAFDALVAGFPAGTVSGAPKIRAMEIIDQMEPVKRGPYAGAVGYFSYSGGMDTCITIRTIIFSGGKAYAQAGAGIVADSDPDSEYEETVNKAKVLIRALQLAEEGLM